MLLNLVIGIIVTRSLGPELRGEYGQIKLVTAFYGPMLLFGYNGGVMYYAIRKELNISTFFYTGLLVVVSIGIPSTILLYFLSINGFVGTAISLVPNLELWLGMASIPLIMCNAYVERIFKANHHFVPTNIRRVLGALITLIILLSAMFVSNVDLFISLIAILGGQITQLVLSLWFVFRRYDIRPMLEFNVLIRPWKFGLKSFLNQIISKSNEKFDQIALSFLTSATHFGYYSVGVGLSALVSRIPSSYADVFFNQIVSSTNERSLELYARAQRITFLITTAVALLLAGVSVPLVRVLYGTEFMQSALIIVFYTPGLIFQVAARLSVKFYAGRGRPLRNSLVYVIGLIVGIPFYFILIPNYGIVGAAIASSIGYFAAFTFSVIQIRNEYSLNIASIFLIQKADLMFLFDQLNVLRKK